MGRQAESKDADKAKETLSSASGVYLLLYNVAQMIGWNILFALIVMHSVAEETHIGLYTATGTVLKIFQTAAVLEVVHCVFGLVKSNVVLTAFQVASRVFLTWGILHNVSQIQDNIGVLMLLLAWSITEIIRYGFYAFNLLGSVPYLLIWCRYTLFIILYPIGVTGELLCIYHSLPHVKKSGMFSLELPNRLNFSFSYYYALFVVMFSYIPVFPQLYFHMFHQRRKVLGADSRKKKD